MGLGSTQLSCPNCKSLCDTKGISWVVFFILISLTVLTFGIGLIIILLYTLASKKQPIECPHCGYRWQP
jgi:DNA-directed RNA polymerase subunit RPC12/RpoP